MVLKEIIIKDEKYNICVNPLVECMGVMFILADFNLNKTRSNKKYVQNVLEHFSAYKNHEAVAGIKKLLQSQYFRYNAPVEMSLLMFYNLPISLEFCQNCMIEKEDVDKFLCDLQDFIKASNFSEFFESNKKNYLQQIAKFQKELQPFSPVDYLVNFLKLKAKKLNVLLMFGVSTANYGIEVANKPYCCVRPYKSSRDDEIDFTFNKPYVTTLLLHEFAHTIINPLTSKFRNKVALIDKEKFKLCLELNPYGDDIETVVNEHVIRAIECMYVKDTFPEDYKNFLEDYKSDGFLCLEELENLYQVYLKDKEKNFADYYENIIEYFVNGNIYL